jgi:hypothetical protein
LPKQQSGKLIIRKVRAGLIEVPEYLFGRMQEGYGTKHEEAETKLKGKFESDRSHV